MELNKKIQVGLNKHIEPTSIIWDKGNGFFVYQCKVYYGSRVIEKSYHSLHITELIKRYERRSKNNELFHSAL